MCYAALVHEYFVILPWWRVCVMLLWCMSTFHLSKMESVCYALWCMSTLLSYHGGECVLCCSGA